MLNLQQYFLYISLFYIPYVAGFCLVNYQQVSVNLVYELRCNPAQGHPNLVLCYMVVIL